MAGSWIKFDTSTSDKPEVWQIATTLSIDPDAVVGKLLRIWIWFDEHSLNGNAPSVTKALLDRCVCVTGFCAAMIESGWMVEAEGEISLPNFERHNGQTAKNRAQTATRVSKKRQNSNASSVTQSLPPALQERYLEKRREEKNISPSLPAEKRAIGFEPEWNRWLDFRLSQDGRELNTIQADAVLYKLASLPPEKAARDIVFSIEKGAKTILDSDNDFDKRRQERTNQQQQPKKRNFTL